VPDLEQRLKILNERLEYLRQSYELIPVENDNGDKAYIVKMEDGTYLGNVGNERGGYTEPLRDLINHGIRVYKDNSSARLDIARLIKWEQDRFNEGTWELVS